MSDRYVVIGNPVAHSKSPLIHACFAKQCHQQLVYDRLQPAQDGFSPAVFELIAGGAKGANVTVPFKQDAWRLATSLSERATVAEAVNTLSFKQGEIVGDNTDGVGLTRDIVDNLGINLVGKRVLLLGAGGAVRGVLLPLLALAPAQLVIANRTIDKATVLARQFSAYGDVVGGSYVDLAGQSFDVVINGTSASLSDALPPVPAGVFASGSLAYDMMYGKALTPFLYFAQSQGVATLADGLGMLVEQAAEAFMIWRGVRPQTAPVLQMLREQMV
ncbi:shikimate dehydrogenase [Chitinivorax sp. B]|uniref:shikimate dehydrogenase n=1 Tax=Chitinivorax sp. B TaxID=2502235 RepID=UPI0010F60896|nr:shikimate dehydrogenase [Chitinivorax sp. B]